MARSASTTSSATKRRSLLRSQRFTTLRKQKRTLRSRCNASQKMGAIALPFFYVLPKGQLEKKQGQVEDWAPLRGNQLGSIRSKQVIRIN